MPQFKLIKHDRLISELISQILPGNTVSDPDTSTLFSDPFFDVSLVRYVVRNHLFSPFK